MICLIEDLLDKFFGVHFVVLMLKKLILDLCFSIHFVITLEQSIRFSNSNIKSQIKSLCRSLWLVSIFYKVYVKDYFFQSNFQPLILARRIMLYQGFLCIKVLQQMSHLKAWKSSWVFICWAKFCWIFNVFYRCVIFICIFTDV